MRIALVIQYLGTRFHGWQRQSDRRTVQEEIETVLAEIIGKKVTLHGAGRTDSGVHAAAQVAHFDYQGPIPATSWSKILNSRLADDILIKASNLVPEDWHARFSAIWRRYRYTLYTDKLPNLFVQPFAWHYYYEPLQESLIQSALTPLVGKHNLTAFRRAGSERSHSWVEVQAAECYRQDPFLYLEIQANGFLYGMVRLLMGILVEVGRGQVSPQEFTQIWQHEQRERVKYSAPAKGLCLLRVGYTRCPFSQSIWFDTQPKFVFNEQTATNIQMKEQ